MMGPSSVSNSMSCILVNGRVKFSTCNILVFGLRAGDGVRFLSAKKDICISLHAHVYELTFMHTHKPLSVDSLLAFASASCLALSLASILLLVSSS